MKDMSTILRESRKKNKLSQADLAAKLNQCGYALTNKVISKWELGQGEPSASVFVEICRILGIIDIYETCLGSNPNSPLSQLNETGKEKVYEYANLLIASGQFQKPSAKIIPFERKLPLYEEPVSAGVGNFLTGDCFETITVGSEVPANADFGVRVSGNSMEPRFINGQIVFVHQQNLLENGEIGIFLLDGEAYIKKLQNDENGRFLISLNKDYEPLLIEEHSEFSVLGKVIG
jgi:phage repressor protein C with HTH and peptisase S24 domain